MVRPRHRTYVGSAETQRERFEESFSRRKLMRVAGVAGASFVAGCGGGGQETPTATATEAPGRETRTATATEAPDRETRTATATEEATPTPGETLSTPTGEVTVTDEMFHSISGSNFESINPNPWHAESATFPQWYRFRSLGFASLSGESKAGSYKSYIDGAYYIAARQLAFDPEDMVTTITFRDDLTYGDGTPFTAETAMMNWKITSALLELGEQSEATMPLSMEQVDDHTARMQVLPGNPALRLIGVFQQNSQLSQMGRTHPKFHREFVESITSATTTKAKENAVQKLFSATFPADRLPAMALGPWKATEWNPSEMTFAGRENFPWGLDYHPEQSRIFRGLRLQTIGEEQNRINAAIAGQNDYICNLPSKRVRNRFDQDQWQFWEDPEPTAGFSILFSPKSKWGQKTEKARKMRQAVAFLVDSEKIASVIGRTPAYELSTGFVKKESFQNWVGDEFFEENFTNYGKRDTGYFFRDEASQKLREADFERNKSGTWIDGETGDPLTSSLTLSSDDINNYAFITRGTIDVLIDGLADHGIEVSAKTIPDEQYNNDLANFDFELSVAHWNQAVGSHPYFGMREDFGLGSIEGLPGAFYFGDWRNGIRRVKVPMPVGNPDGTLTTFDYDRNVQEMPQLSDDAISRRVRTIAWVLNQWVPMLGVMQIIGLPAMNGARVDVTEDFHGEYGSAPSPALRPFDAWSCGWAPVAHFAAGFYQPAEG